jgi:hypothetical protein
MSLPLQAALIPIGTGDLNVVGSSVPEGDRDEDNVVNGSGVGLVDGKIISTTTQPNGNNWNTLTEFADITFDLGAVYNIDFIHIWNFNDGFGNSDFGPESFKLLVSSVGSNAQNADFSGVSIIPTLSIQHAPSQIGYLGANYRFNGKSEADIPTELGEDELYNLSFLAVKGRFVRLADLDGAFKSFGGRAGLSEIRFYGTPIPLPAAVWLMGSALLGLVFVGRRKIS